MAGNRAATPSINRQDGAAAIEFALVFVLFFMVLYGAIAYGMVFALKHSMTQAAAEGARAALKDVGEIADREALAQSTAKDALSWLSTLAPIPTPQVSHNNCDPTTEYVCITVKLEYDYAAHPIVPGIPGLGIVLPDKLYSQAVVQLDTGTTAGP